MSLTMSRITGARLFKAPFEAVLGVFDVEAESGETVADEVAGGPVFISLGFGAHLEQQVDGLLEGFKALVSVARGGLDADSEDVDQIGVEKTCQSLDGLRAERSLTVGGAVHGTEGVEEHGDDHRSVQVVVHRRLELGAGLLTLGSQRRIGAVGMLDGKIEVVAAGVHPLEAVLAALSNQTCDHLDELTLDLELIGELDFIFAKAALSRHYRGCEPRLNKDGIIRLKNARHPLLDPHRVVPITLTLGENFDLLIVTGPNTGGKTVSLKTVGLFTLMGQAGLHIPAWEGSELAVFDNVFADIGDEQSIEQSLSTFSAHMTNTVRILEEADSRSLCLFDELGAGTDPTEGAALAIAMLSFLHNMKCRTMATTHYSELKVFALTTPGVENACCEFNVETLQPTYRLLIGVPGKSNAFAISKKLGLPDYIIEDAKNHLEAKDESFEDLLTSLENSRVTIEKEQQEIAEYKERIRTLQEQLQKKNEKIDQAKDKILRDANEKARAILQEAKDVADETIRDFNKAGASADIKELEKKRQKVRDKINEKNGKLALGNTQKKPADQKTVDPKKLKKGDSVKIISMNLKGIVNTLPDARGNLFVQCGIMRMQTNINDLVPVKEETITAPALQRTNTGKLKMSKSFSVSSEINLLGCTVDEAIAKLDKYLDDAYLAHLPSVRVVHGKGTGALRSAVQSHLKRLKYVKEYRLGEYGEGDAGVTIVTFK